MKIIDISMKMTPNLGTCDESMNGVLSGEETEREGPGAILSDKPGVFTCCVSFCDFPQSLFVMMQHAPILKRIKKSKEV